MNLILCAAFLLLWASATSAQQQETVDSGEATSAQSLLAEATRGSDLDACLRQEADLRRPGQERIERAGEGRPVQTRRLVLAVDNSGSMTAKIGAQTKIEAARQAALAFLAQVPSEVEVGLLVFGHKGTNQEAGKSESCRAVETLYEVAPAKRDEIARAVERMTATGWTPLAAALERLASLFKPSEVAGEQVVWVVSDGVETCGGDPVAAARALNEGGAKVVVNIIGFDVPARERGALEAVAKAGGGVFKEARTGRDLERVLAEGRELRGRLMAEARASSATALNSMRTNMAVNRMNACLRQRMLQESQRLRLRTLAKTDPAVVAAAEEATRLLDERHDKVRGLADAYAEALGNADAQMAERIAQDLRRALAGQGQ